MTRLALFIIRLVAPPRDREWLVGDTIEELGRIRQVRGDEAARRWLRREMWRVVAHTPRHRLAALRRAGVTIGPGTQKGDGAVRDFVKDVRYTLRLLGRAPAFTAVAVTTLALGIGANTAIFAAVNALLLKPLPFKGADRLMLVHMMVPDFLNPGGAHRESVWSYPKYRTFESMQQVFEEIAFFAGRDFDLSGDGEPQRVRGEVVTERYPTVLGVTPTIGRTFSHDEVHKAGTPAAAVIGHGLWTRRFGADVGVLGRTIHINATPYTIAGVLPPGFLGLTGHAEIWVPLAAFEPSQLTQPQSHSYTIIARRRSDVSEAKALAAVHVIGGQIDAAHPRSDVGAAAAPWGATAASLYESRVDADVRQGSFVLFGAVGFVLLIACVNLTNLVAAKAMARRREVAVRVAIGASRGRIVRQFLAEGLILAIFGAIAGLALAWALLAAAGTLLPDPDVFFRTPIAPGARRITGAAGLTRIGVSTIGFDGATLVFTAGVALITAMLVSLLPAVQASLLRPVDALKAGGRPSGHRRWFDARTTLVTAQIALALILLAGAGLMIRSAERLRGTPIGVRPERLLTVRVDLPRAMYDNARGGEFFARLVERVRAVPGVESAALGLCAPVSGGCNGTTLWFPPAGPRRDGTDPIVGIHWVTPEYFSTLGIRLLKGRTFTERDRSGQPKVILVNEAAARANWPNADPIGRRIAVGQGAFHDGAEVIGIVSDVKYRTIESPQTADVYIPLAQSYQSRMRLFVRTGLDPGSLAPAVAREVHALDPNLPLSEVKTMNERVADAMWRTRVAAWLLASFAALALLLTAIGIFGVMAQAVAQRTAEIGIRMALGAQPRNVLGLVLGRAVIVTVVGIAIGTASALALTRLMTALLYGVEPWDPATFGSVVVLLGAIALGAGYIPARRATRVDVIAALRAE